MISEINEVLSVRESEKLLNGVRVVSRWVELSTSEGIIKTKVGNGIEINEGYSGKAIFLLRSINSTVEFKGQKPQPITYFLPSELIKWEQGQKVNHDVSGLLNSLLTSKK
ncbi:MAG: hypothetical protein PHW82_17045 [Bacteroidales bacterium]|nr:hypothetical protein [Bacteroidales bacterium]